MNQLYKATIIFTAILSTIIYFITYALQSQTALSQINGTFISHFTIVSAIILVGVVVGYSYALIVERSILGVEDAGEIINEE